MLTAHTFDRNIGLRLRESWNPLSHDPAGRHGESCSNNRFPVIQHDPLETPRMIRVLHVIATLDPAGAERQMVQLCRRLDSAIFEPRVCCLTRGGPLEAPLADSGVQVSILHKRGKCDPGAILGLRRLIRQVQPDILHTWLPTANTIGRLAALGCRIPAWVASERAADIWKGPLRRWLDRRLEKHTARILCNAHAVRRFLVRRIGLREEKITVIPNGLDLAEFDDAASLEPVAPLPDPRRSPLIGVVGRLEPQKGITHLIAAMPQILKLLGDADLWIIGDGPEGPALRKQARDERLLEHVRFLGYRSDVPALLKRLDLFVLPSLWEGLPNAALEAMAAARAVVATRVDGTPEAVADNKTGLLVSPRDPRALADAVTRLLTDADLRRRMGAAGRERVAELFSMDKMLQRTEAVYLQLIREARRNG